MSLIDYNYIFFWNLIFFCLKNDAAKDQKLTDTVQNGSYEIWRIHVPLLKYDTVILSIRQVYFYPKTLNCYLVKYI